MILELSSSDYSCNALNSAASQPLLLVMHSGMDCLQLQGLHIPEFQASRNLNFCFAASKGHRNPLQRRAMRNPGSSYLIIYKEFRSFEISGSHSDIVLLARVIEFSQTPVY